MAPGCRGTGELVRKLLRHVVLENHEVHQSLASRLNTRALERAKRDLITREGATAHEIQDHQGRQLNHLRRARLLDHGQQLENAVQRILAILLVGFEQGLTHCRQVQHREIVNGGDTIGCGSGRFCFARARFGAIV